MNSYQYMLGEKGRLNQLERNVKRQIEDKMLKQFR